MRRHRISIDKKKDEDKDKDESQSKFDPMEFICDQSLQNLLAIYSAVLKVQIKIVGYNMNYKNIHITIKKIVILEAE